MVIVRAFVEMTSRVQLAVVVSAMQAAKLLRPALRHDGIATHLLGGEALLPVVETRRWGLQQAVPRLLRYLRPSIRGPQAK